VLGESSAAPPQFAPAPEEWVFVAVYLGLSVLATVVLHRLLARARSGMAAPREGAGVGEATAS
jgi:hypothetical protein